MSESPIVISAFPGVGKTYFYNYMNSMPTETFIVWSGRDSDSSKFPKEGFPQNYVKAIKRDLRNGIQFTQLVSSHKEVRDAMACAGIDYYLVFPENHLKQVYLERYKRRGSPQAFIDLLDKNWETWIHSCEDDQYALKKIVLHHPHAYLKSVFSTVVSDSVKRNAQLPLKDLTNEF